VSFCATKVSALSSTTIELTKDDDTTTISTNNTLTISDVDSAETFVAQNDTTNLYNKFNIDQNNT
jgi:hypothetical protein